MIFKQNIHIKSALMPLLYAGPYLHAPIRHAKNILCDNRHMIYVISDLHGYPHERFLRLLDVAGFGAEDFLYILGDVVDRNGDGGVATLQWLMYQTNAQLIMGNHEASLLACSFVINEITDGFKVPEDGLKIWNGYIMDGGDVTLKALKKLPLETREDIIYYLNDCPYYELCTAGGKDYLLVHSGIEKFDRNKKLSAYENNDFIWARPKLEDRYFDDVITVFGHTPTIYYGDEYLDRIVRTDTWMDIDMGAGSGREPVLLRLDDLKEFRLD